MNESDVVVVGACRTAIGSFGKGLKDVAPCELGTTVLKGLIERTGVQADSIGHVVFGHVVNTEPRDLYLSRVAAINAGIPDKVPAFNVNRLCGSGLQAIISAAQAIQLGDAQVAIGAGAENMSRAPYLAVGQRWGSRMGDSKLLDMMLGALSDPFDKVHMGITAENVAERYDISREQQDALALSSHQRAQRAIQEGRFRDQIVPVTIKSRRGETVFDTDEHFRADATADDFSGLRPVFKEGGTVTAGNASGINDGAGAVLLMSASAAQEAGVTPMARLVSYGHAGVEPLYMGIGPVPASRIALEKAGLTIDQMDVIEANEAFAAQACAVAKELGMDAEKV